MDQRETSSSSSHLETTFSLSTCADTLTFDQMHIKSIHQYEYAAVFLSMRILHSVFMATINVRVARVTPRALIISYTLTICVARARHIDVDVIPKNELPIYSREFWFAVRTPEEFAPWLNARYLSARYTLGRSDFQRGCIKLSGHLSRSCYMR